MTLIVTCKQCGEKNIMDKLINKLKDQNFDKSSKEVDVVQAINKIKPKCGNCFLVMEV